MGLLGELLGDMSDVLSDFNDELKRTKREMTNELRKSYSDIFGMDERQTHTRSRDTNARSDRQATPTPPPVPTVTKAAKPTPPIPEAEEEDMPFKGMYSPKLEMLIDAAITDGILTDSERRLLINNVLLEGVDIQEFDLVLNARLEARRKYLKSRK